MLLSSRQARNALRRAPALGTRARQGSRTRVKTEYKQPKVEHAGGGGSHTYQNFGKFPDPMARSQHLLTAPQEYAINYAGTNLVSSTGQQNALCVPWYDYNVLHTIKGQSATAGGTASIASRVLHNSVKGELVMSNASVFTTSCTIYDIMARRDLHLGVGAGTAESFPTTAWLTGLNYEGGLVSDFKVVGCTPFQSEQFNQFFKVVKVTHLELNPGGVNRHIVSFTPNRIIHNEVVEANSYGLKDLTCWTMVVFHGQPAHDSTNLATEVTVSSASIDFIQSAAYRYRYVQNTSTTFLKTVGLAQSFTNGPQIVNDEVGQVQDAGGLHPATMLS